MNMDRDINMALIHAMVSFFSLLLLLLSGQNIPIDVDVDDVDDLDVVVVEDVSFNDVSSTSTVRTTFIN